MSNGIVQISGPVLDGRGPMIVDDWLRSNMDLVAKLGEDAVKQELDAVLQNPTGYYRSQISSAVRHNSAAGSDVVLHDSGVIYGPWLAGTGSRNAPVTRFKGYNHWRRAAQRMEDLAPQVMVSTLRQLVRKLGG